MRISDWSSDVCSSDLEVGRLAAHLVERARPLGHAQAGLLPDLARQAVDEALALVDHTAGWRPVVRAVATPVLHQQEALVAPDRSEERSVGKECVSTCRYRWSPYH